MNFFVRMDADSDAGPASQLQPSGPRIAIGVHSVPSCTTMFAKLALFLALVALAFAQTPAPVNYGVKNSSAV